MEVLAVGVLVLAIIFVFNRWTNAIEKHEEERLLSKIQEREDRKRREEEARQKEEEEKRRNQEELAVKISLELKQQREASAKARADELAKIREEKAREREEERLRCLARDQELKRRKAKIEEFGFVTEGKWELSELCAYMKEFGITRDMFPSIDADPNILGQKLSNIAEEANLAQAIADLGSFQSHLEILTNVLKNEAERNMLKKAERGEDFPFSMNYSVGSSAHREGMALINLGLLGHAHNYSAEDALNTFFKEYLIGEEINDTIAWFDDQQILVSINHYKRVVWFRKKAIEELELDKVY